MLSESYAMKFGMWIFKLILLWDFPLEIKYSGIVLMLGVLWINHFLIVDPYVISDFFAYVNILNVVVYKYLSMSLFH